MLRLFVFASIVVLTYLAWLNHNKRVDEYRVTIPAGDEEFYELRYYHTNILLFTVAVEIVAFVFVYIYI